MGRVKAARLGLRYFQEMFGSARPDLVVGADSHTRLFAGLIGAKSLISDTVVIRASAIRTDPLKHWDMILPAARPFFLNEAIVVGNRKDLDRVQALSRAAGIFAVRLDHAPPENLKPMMIAARRVARRAVTFCLAPAQFEEGPHDENALAARAGTRRITVLPSAKILGGPEQSKILGYAWGGVVVGSTMNDALDGLMPSTLPDAM